MQFEWARVQNTPGAQEIVADIIQYTSMLGLEYHNIEHLAAMYRYLEETDVPYNEALDWAVLFHDIVYDSKPDKELRSAQMWKRWATGRIDIHINESMVQEVYDLIMTTSDHRGTTPLSFQLIRADLSGLVRPDTTVVNFGKIMRESMNLYNIEPILYAEKTLSFMPKLHMSVIYTKSKDDPKFIPFYEQVERGIRRTMRLSNEVLGQSS